MADAPLLHVVLVQPEIPQNAGNIGRTCVALGAKLWLVRPLGFRMDERHLRRAGLDYWQHLEWEAVDDWAALRLRLPEGFPERYRDGIVKAMELCAVKKNIEVPPEFRIEVEG